MASMGPGFLDPEPSVRTIRNGGYINKLLIAICVAEGLNKVGVKAELQQRIIESTSTPPTPSHSLAPKFFVGDVHFFRVHNMILTTNT
jgi:hypothetical protein